MRFSKTRALAFSLNALAVGCSGPQVGEILAQDVNVSVVGTASAPEVAALGDPQGGLGVTRAFVSASSLSLVPCAEGASEIVLEPRGYELLYETPFSEEISTAVSEFCSLRFDIDPVASNAPSDIPKGASLYVAGQDAADMPFELSSESSASFTFEVDNGGSFGAQALLLGFDLSTWLAGLPVADDPAMTATLFDSQLRASAALYADANGNQALDEDEQTPIARAVPPR